MENNALTLYLVGQLAGGILEFIARISPSMAEFLNGLESVICQTTGVQNGG